MNEMDETLTEEVLTTWLLEQQPHSEGTLETVRRYFFNRGSSAFAQIRNGQCGACRISVAAVRLQKAKLGRFINCANCARFLYIPEAVRAESVKAAAERTTQI